MIQNDQWKASNIFNDLIEKRKNIMNEKIVWVNFILSTKALLKASILMNIMILNNFLMK